MNRPVTTSIDKNFCIGCGLCVKVCPSDTISLQNGKAEITGDRSLGCGHCEAICPENAVKVGFNDSSQLEFNNLELTDDWIKPGAYDETSLVSLMMSRRSCRNYKDKQVDISLLEDLVKIGTTAPSGTNSQMWNFRIIQNRKSVLAFGEKVLGFFKKLNRVAENSFLRNLLKFSGKPELSKYYEEYYERIKEKIYEYETDKTDSLFHGAQSAILVGSSNEASCPFEDAMLATQNILLGAHALGLGTCLIGFAVEAIKNDKSLKKAVNLRKDEKIYSVIAIGYPDEKYVKTCKRKKINPQILRFE